MSHSKLKTDKLIKEYKAELREARAGEASATRIAAAAITRLRASQPADQPPLWGFWTRDGDEETFKECLREAEMGPDLEYDGWWVRTSETDSDTFSLNPKTDQPILYAVPEAAFGGRIPTA